MLKILKKILNFIIEFLQGNNSSTTTLQKQQSYEYETKPIMTQCEKKFYDCFITLEDELNIIIQPQVNLSSIINKKNNGYQNELFRNIDFGVFTNDYSKLLLLIEINDSSHNKSNRKARDEKVKSICANANIKLITYYTDKPNEKNYVINRLRTEINNNLNTNNNI